MRRNWLRNLPVIHPLTIELNGITKTFSKQHALRDLNLGVAEGEIIALIGKSGSGKSTLIKIMNLMSLPSSGTVTILGHEVSSSGAKARLVRRHVATIHQGLALVPRLSVIENTLQGALGSLIGPRLGLLSYPKHLRTTAEDLLQELGIGEKCHHPLSQLSGGQQQRVAIARALMQRPKIILADEPISSLDPETSVQVLTLLKKYALELNLTVVVAIHQIEFIEGFADRVIGLKNGQIAMDVQVENFDDQFSKVLFTDAKE
jgi:phosphonate transport system ATP-binding protein